MTTLQGGVSASGGGGLGGATPWGMIIEQINRTKDNMRQSFQNTADNTNKIAFSASSWRPSFTPVQSQFIAPQNMNTQQNTGMSNLYNYLMG
jgi:hypothetical protein